MKRKYFLMLGVCLGVMSFEADAYNEPYAGAIVRKDSEVSPKSDFRPGDITNIMPEVKKDEDKEQEIYFSADEMEAIENEGVIVAKGNVIVTRDNLELTSDRLWYNQKEDVIKAQGNVILKEADGSVLYTDEITLSQKMNRAEIDKVKVIMRDESRILADKFVKKVDYDDIIEVDEHDRIRTFNGYKVGPSKQKLYQEFYGIEENKAVWMRKTETALLFFY